MCEFWYILHRYVFGLQSHITDSRGKENALQLSGTPFFEHVFQRVVTFQFNSSQLKVVSCFVCAAEQWKKTVAKISETSGIKIALQFFFFWASLNVRIAIIDSIVHLKMANETNLDSMAMLARKASRIIHFYYSYLPRLVVIVSLSYFFLFLCL